MDDIHRFVNSLSITGSTAFVSEKINFTEIGLPFESALILIIKPTNIDIDSGDGQRGVFGNKQITVITLGKW